MAMAQAGTVSTEQAAAEQEACAAAEPAPEGGRRKQGARSFMAANAGLRNWTAAQFMGFLLLTAVTQLSWGLYGVCTRYLQVQTAKPIPTLQLMVCLNLLAWPGMIMFASVPNWAKAYWKARKQRLATEAAAATDGEGKADAAAADEEAPAELAGAATSDGGPPQPSRKQRLRKWLKTQALTHGIATVVALQAMTNVYAAKEANAYIAQMIFMTAPLFAAIANRVVLKQPTPYGLWPTVVLTIAGAVLVVVGQLQQNSEETGANTTSTGKLILGCCLALLSTLLLTAYFVLVQVTRHLVSGEAVLWANRNVGLLLFVPLSLIVDGTDWSWVAGLSGEGWGVLIFAGLYIYTLCNIWLQICTRALGAALISAFLSLRLVSSVVGSIIVLSETPSKAITWVGLGLVAAVTAGFVLAQHHHKRRTAQQAAAAAAAAAAADEEARRGAPIEEAEGAEPAPAAGHWGSFMSHGASFLRGPSFLLGESAASFQRRQLRSRTAPARTFMDALGKMSDGLSPELLLLERDLSDDEGDSGGDGGGSPNSKPASST